jgi:electron transfer flavoprotein alpha subunit
MPWWTADASGAPYRRIGRAIKKKRELLLTAVWVYIEQYDNGIRDTALEAAGEGRALADALHLRLHLAALGGALDGLVEELSRLDADALYLLEHPLLENGSPGLQVDALFELLTGFPPGPVLFSATSLGDELAPRLAARLNLPFAAGCIWAKAGPAGDLRLVQPIHQERVQRTLSIPAGRGVVASLRPGVIGIDLPAHPRPPEVVRLQPQLTVQRDAVGIMRFEPGDPRNLPLPEAEVIVAGGRGAHDEEAWRLLETLADLLGATTGGTRLALDLGYIERKQMIGQTGAWTQPRLYLAAGISGVPHHMGGVKAGTLIAINSDAHAPIFKQGTLNVVSDLHQVLPRLIKKIQAVKAGEG